MECLNCFKRIEDSVHWSNFFKGQEERKLCEACLFNLQKITGARCTYCSRQTNKKVCFDCKRWKQIHNNYIESNYSIFVYNDFMKDLITKWKYRGDYKIAETFMDEFIEAFKHRFTFIKEPIIVPIPVSEERLRERAFNQAKQLARFLPGERVEALSRKHSEKQSKKKRVERIASENPFLVEGPIYKPVILVDDIYTTGSTLQHAAERLKEKGCPAVYGFTLIRG